MSCDCEKEQIDEGRRSFLNKLIFGIGSVIGLGMAFPLVTAMLDPVTRKGKNLWRKVGKVTDFELGKTKKVIFKNSVTYKWGDKLSESAAFVRRKTNNEFEAFSVNCTHLGCPVRWEQKPEMFFCPCHGGVYYKDGSTAAGPPPKPLPRYPLRVRNGIVEVQTEEIPITNLKA